MYKDRHNVNRLLLVITLPMLVGCLAKLNESNERVSKHVDDIGNS